MKATVENIGPLINRMQRFDKDVYRILQREIRAGAQVVADDAKTRVPSGNALTKFGPWNLTTGRNATRGAVQMSTGSRDLGFDGSKVRRSIKPSARTVRRRGRGVTGIEGRVTLRDVGGAIWALAGSRTNSPFNRVLNARFGSSLWPRALTPALYAKGPQAAKNIDDAIQRAADAVT